MRALEISRRRDGLQPRLHRIRVFARSEPGAVGDPENMGVHRDGGVPERLVQHHIGGLAPDARQAHQILARARHLAAKFLDDQARQGDDVFGLVAEQADRLDEFAHAVFAQRQHGVRIVRHREQSARGLVHAHIGGLG